MSERPLEQIEAEVEAAIAAMNSHLSSDMDIDSAFEAKHPELAHELGRALVQRDIEKIATAEFERLVTAGKMHKVGPGEYRTVMEVSHNQPAGKEAKLTINLREVTDLIGTLAPCDGKSIWEQVADRYPLYRNEFLRIGALLGAQVEEIARERVAMERVARVAGRYGFGPDNPEMTLGEALRRAADEGDKEAAAAVDELNSLATKACDALFEAAAERHPHWRAVPGRPGEYCGPRANHPERDPERLLAWFERTYPAEAARITAETMACFWVAARALLEPCPQCRS